MLGKLIKHEFKATSRQYVLIFIAAIALAILNRFTMDVESDNVIVNLASGLLMLAYIILLFSLILASIIISVNRFSKNLFGDEAYLTHTLPVKTGSLIISKLIAATVWFGISMMVMLLSIFIFASDNTMMKSIKEFFDEMVNFFGKTPAAGRFTAELIILFIVSIIIMILMIYAAAAFGNLFNKHKKLAGVLGYFGLSYFMQIIMSIISDKLIDTIDFEQDINTVKAFEEFVSYFDKLFIAVMVISIIMGVISYAITHWVLSKRLNIE